MINPLTYLNPKTVIKGSLEGGTQLTLLIDLRKINMNGRGNQSKRLI
jgi:hypothetical protein